MSHLTEQVLGLYAIDPARVSPAERAHLAGCDECQAELRALREFEELLRDPVTWTGVSAEAPRASNEMLRAYAARMAEEDEQALELLEEFKEPSAAARFAWMNVASNPQYQTGGVARLLCRLANQMCERDPLYALKLAEAATIISQGLPDTTYPRKTIHDLRGEALKEQANALFFLGRLPKALRAVGDAEAEYRKLSPENVGLAAATYVRGLLHREQGDFDAAEKAAHEAAESARRLGVPERYMSAKYLLGYVFFDRHEYARALAIFEEILRYGESIASRDWVARASLAVGACCLELRRLDDASRSSHLALRLFSELQLTTDITHAQWTIARLIFMQGNASEAIYRLRRCIAQFTQASMLTDAAMVAVDVAEILDATGRRSEIPKILAHVVQTFIDAGKLSTALAALAYLKDAATEGSITPRLVAHVRRFVQRAERQPDSVFVRPPG